MSVTPTDPELDLATHMSDQPTASLEKISQALRSDRSDLSQDEVTRRSQTIFQDIVLLARCAKSKCLITYAAAIELRGHGNAQNGQWLDDVFAYAIRIFDFPDLTLLIVNKATKQPSPDIFKNGRANLSDIHVDDVPMEQKRCCWFEGYESILGELPDIPYERHLVRLLTPEPKIEREIARAVNNALNRISSAGKERSSIGKEYIDSISRTELVALVKKLWDHQNGRCALTDFPFELCEDEDGGMRDDRVSLDRIDNAIGYTYSNVQLTTQFANRSRGTLSVMEAKKRLVQHKLYNSDDAM